MIDLHKILYATISGWELQERLRRDDFDFDAWKFLSKQIGLKGESNLRNMCQPRKPGGNAAKLGVEEAVVIMSITGDYRLLKFVVADLKRRKEQQKEQLNLFSEPLRTLESCYE